MAGTRVTSGTLVASTVDTVTFTAYYAGVSITNRDASAEIFVRADGVNPTVEGDDCYIVPPGKTVTVYNGLPVADQSTGVNAGTNVRLISSGTPKFTVAGVN